MRLNDRVVRAVQRALDKAMEDVDDSREELQWAKPIKISIEGIEVSINSNYPVLDYNQDWEYMFYKKRMLERAKVLDQAFVATHPVVTKDGEVVESPPIKSKVQTTITICVK